MAPASGFRVLRTGLYTTCWVWAPLKTEAAAPAVSVGAACSLCCSYDRNRCILKAREWVSFPPFFWSLHLARLCRLHVLHPQEQKGSSPNFHRHSAECSQICLRFLLEASFRCLAMAPHAQFTHAHLYHHSETRFRQEEAVDSRF